MSDAVGGFAKTRKARTTPDAPKQPLKGPEKRRSPKPDQILSRDDWDAVQASRTSEEVWRRQMRGFATDAGFRMQYHTHRSDRSDAGWPDEVIYRPGGRRVSTRLLFYEVKRESGVLTPDQIDWLDALAAFRDYVEAHITGTTRLMSYEVYGAVRPSDRDAWIDTLFVGTARADESRPLHQWCLEPQCERCTTERERTAKRYRSRHFVPHS